MALQDIIDSAVNVEVNRSKLVAQTISRSGRISTASRNWANPFRFTVTPKPVWTAAEYRSAFSSLLDNDRYLPHGFYLNNIDATTRLADLGNSWMVNYQGEADANSDIFDKTFVSGGAMGAFTVTLNNATSLIVGMRIIGTGITGYSTITNIAGSVITIAAAFTVQAAGTYTAYNPGKDNGLDSYQASSQTSGAMLCLTNRNSLLITAGLYIAKEGDYLRLANTRYPYIATADVEIPTAASTISGTITAADTTVFLQPNISGVFAGLNVSFVSTTTRTSVTGITDTSVLSVGQIITSTGAYSKTYVSGGAISAFTVTLNNVTSLTVGMKVYGTGLANGATITVIAGSQLTLDTAFTIQATGTYTIGGNVGGLTYIAEIPSPTYIIIQSTTACTAGAIVFDGTGPTSTPTVCVPVHRGYIGTVSGNTTVLVGARGAQFVVNVVKLPQIRYLPGQLVELTGDIELVEAIL